jgi:general secretion pathway protein G
MEMVVVLAILSLLAAMAAPYARTGIKREKEIHLRETLRTVRTAIDRFHADMERAARKKGHAGGTASRQASESGYPLSLQTLVDGVEIEAAETAPQSGAPPAAGKLKRYLRSLPVNPFAPPGTPLEKQWTIAGYQREAPRIATSSYGLTLAEANEAQGGIYDLHAVTPEIALDGTPYASW